MTFCLVALGTAIMDTEDVPLLEREAQLASLGEYAAEARAGDGRMVLVAGEAGAGKSVLVEQLQRDLPTVSWFWGACDGLFTPRPLGPLFDIAAKLGGELLELCRADAPRPDLFSSPAPCGGCAVARNPSPRARRPSHCSNRWARLPNWRGLTRTWPASG
jgi:hypothetical protein